MHDLIERMLQLFRMDRQHDDAVLSETLPPLLSARPALLDDEETPLFI